MKSGRIKRITFGLSAVALAIVVISSQFPAPKTEVSHLPLQKNAPTSDAPDFASIVDVAAKKTQFFDYLRPKVERENAKIEADRSFLIGIEDKLRWQRPLSTAEHQQLTDIANRYKIELRQLDVDSIQMLLRRVDVIPTDMVLVQAANESGWGSSRFALEGNNYFGQWCFSKGCGLVPNARSSGMNHEVARFADVDASIAAYLLNLNTNGAYQELREVRGWLRTADQPVTAEDLIPSLLAYSERKQAYVDELLDMLKHNERLL